MTVQRIAPDDDDQSVPDWDKQRIAVQAVLSGLQDVHVIARSASAAGMNHGCIAIRIGRLLIYVEDRDALTSLADAVKKAAELEATAYGVRWAPVYQPRNPMSR